MSPPVAKADMERSRPLFASAINWHRAPSFSVHLDCASIVFHSSTIACSQLPSNERDQDEHMATWKSSRVFGRAVDGRYAGHFHGADYQHHNRATRVAGL